MTCRFSDGAQRASAACPWLPTWPLWPGWQPLAFSCFGPRPSRPGLVPPWHEGPGPHAVGCVSGSLLRRVHEWSTRRLGGGQAGRVRPLPPPRLGSLLAGDRPRQAARAGSRCLFGAARAGGVRLRRQANLDFRLSDAAAQSQRRLSARCPRRHVAHVAHMARARSARGF